MDSGGQGRPNVAPGGEGQDTDLMLALSYDAAGRRLGVSGRTVRRLVAESKLPAVDIGACRRIRVADLAAYVAGL